VRSSTSTRPLAADANRQRLDVYLPFPTLVRIVAAGLAFVVLAGLLDVMRGVLVWTLGAVFLALAVEPLVHGLERRGLSRRSATLIVYLGVGVGVIAFLAAVLAPLALQVTNLVDDGPRILREIEHSAPVQDLDRRFHVIESVRSALSHAPDKAPDAAALLLGLTGTVFGVAVGLFTVFFIALFTTLELPQIRRLTVSLLPPERAEVTERRLDLLNRTVARYVGANLAVSGIASTVHFVALYLLGVPVALVLALLVGFFDLVPLVGATIGGIIVVGVALTQGLTVGLAALALVVIYQQVENHLIQPVIMGRGVDVSPLVVILSVLFGSALLGMLGAVLAIPAAASIQIWMRDALERRRQAMTAIREAEDRDEVADATHEYVV
jgi:predicted PurR-regulated permease PerM